MKPRNLRIILTMATAVAAGTLIAGLIGYAAANTPSTATSPYSRVADTAL
jgi:HAMP domain-containing protein